MQPGPSTGQRGRADRRRGAGPGGAGQPAGVHCGGVCCVFTIVCICWGAVGVFEAMRLPHCDTANLLWSAPIVVNCRGLFS